MIIIDFIKDYYEFWSLSFVVKFEFWIKSPLKFYLPILIQLSISCKYDAFATQKAWGPKRWLSFNSAATNQEKPDTRPNGCSLGDSNEQLDQHSGR
jgi:hypothetical protein